MIDVIEKEMCNAGKREQKNDELRDGLNKYA